LLELGPGHRLVGVEEQRHEIEQAFGAVHGGGGSMWTKNPGPSRRHQNPPREIASGLTGCRACEPVRGGTKARPRMLASASVQASGRVRALQPTVFSEFSALAARAGAVNLGQGFPDFDGPEVVREAAVAALRRGENQYAHGLGAPPLRQAIA